MSSPRDIYQEQIVKVLFEFYTAPVIRMVRFQESHPPYKQYVADAKTGVLELPVYDKVRKKRSLIDWLLGISAAGVPAILVIDCEHTPFCVEIRHGKDAREAGASPEPGTVWYTKPTIYYDITPSEHEDRPSCVIGTHLVYNSDIIRPETQVVSSETVKNSRQIIGGTASRDSNTESLNR